MAPLAPGQAPSVPAQGSGHEPALAQVFPLPPASQPLEAVSGAPVPDLHLVPPAPLEVAGTHEPRHGLQVQLPLIAVPVQSEGRAAESAAEAAPELDGDVAADVAPETAAEVSDEAPSAARAAVDRTVLLAATAAGFVGGAVSAVAMHSLFG